MHSQLAATTELIGRLSRLFPHYNQSEMLRMALLLSLHCPSRQSDQSDSQLRAQCHDISLQLGAAGDQHAALSDELDSVAATAPSDFSPRHVFTLVRAIKVQSQVLNLYLGPLEVNR